MKTELFEALAGRIKNWWVSAVIGVLFIIAAILFMVYPDTAYATLSIMFAILMFVAGILEIFFAASNRQLLPGWGWYLALGIIDLIIGGILLINPILAAAILPYLLAFWLMFRGFSLIGYSIDLQRFGSKTWGWYLALGILIILFSIGIIFVPIAGALSIVYIISFILLFTGIARIMLAFDLRKLYRESKRIKERLRNRQ